MEHHEAPPTPSRGESPGSFIVLGASAGGVESLIDFFEAVPGDVDAAFLVVLHRAPDVESSLDEVLSNNASLPVVSLEAKTRIRRGHVYVPPPRGRFVVRSGVIDWDEGAASAAPIRLLDDTFGRVADAFGDDAIAVVLSGSGTDGGLGAQAIKAAGGMVLIQDPDHAAFDGMPRTVAEAVKVDASGTPAVLATMLRGLIEVDGAASAAETPSEDPLDRVVELLRRSNGYDFRSYRRSTVSRRVRRRAVLRDKPHLDEYLELLATDDREREALCCDLLINVTGFFRDQPCFDALDEQVLRKLATARIEGPIRVWVPGCATGEEAYTIAILLSRALEQEGRGQTFQVFATDLDAKAIETASHGEFDARIRDRVPAPLLKRYFVEAGDGYRVRRAVRERMVFAVHDLTQDPPFTRMDLVSCRNLLIYFRNELQRHVLQLLAYALRGRGYLFLGASETANVVRELFDPTDSEKRIFRRNATAVVAPRLHSLDALLREQSTEEAPRASNFESRNRGANAQQAALVERLVLRDATFALALDPQLRLQHVYGDPGNALRVPNGGITTEITALTRGEFKAAILAAVPRALRTREDCITREVAIDGPDGVQMMDVLVVPLDGAAGTLASLVLVRPGTARVVTEEEDAVPARAVNVDLEKELHDTRDQLTETIEALEVSNEEFQTSNEELMATNEELQSTNEELQSANEELHTVNTQHELQVERLTEVTQDLEHVLVNSELGTILLDRDLSIHRFTEVAAQIVHLMEQDRGRPLHHITHDLVGIDLPTIAREVLASEEAFEAPVRATDRRAYFLRCCPTRDESGAVDGVMLTFSDVTALERVTDDLRRSERRFRHVMEHLTQAVFLRSRRDRSIDFVSDHAIELLGIEPTVTDPERIIDFVHPDDVDVVRDAFAAPLEFEVEFDFRLAEGDEGGDRWLHCSLCPTEDDRGEEGFDVGYLFDITARKRGEIALRREVDRFEGFVNAIPDQFFWRGIDGTWVQMRSLTSNRKIDPKRYPSLEKIVPRSALRAIDEAAEAALTEGTLQALSFDAHDTKGSHAYEARLLMVEGQGVICSLRDVSDLRRSERELVTLTRSLEREANSDHLTRLPNRRGLEKVLFAELERSRRLGNRLCAILVDCDNFKRVNDTMGHATGDIVLQEIGKRLRGVVRPSDTIGRVGGDEFLVLLPDTRHAEAMQLAERLRLAITGSPLTSGRDVIGITGSLGVATVAADVVSIEEVISLTQHALSHSKKVGKNRVTSHEFEGLDSIDPRDELLTVLESGRGFRTFAQPILDLQTGKIDGYELLTRGPGGALESPADIFQLSSENNILTSVDLHCVKRNVGWARDHLDHGRFHVNLFPSTILDTPAARLLAVFGDPGLLRHFCVEISEQQFIGDPAYLRPHVEELRREGARIALDDVGFGRSSLESLLLLEPETVKLDKSVVQGACEDAARRRTLERLVGVIRGIDADIVAEGVETDADRELLLELGVEFGQGYLFGKPGPELVHHAS